MSTRNRYSPLAPQNEVLPLLPPPEDHQVIEFEERPVTPVEELRIRSIDAIAVPSSAQKEQGSIPELDNLTVPIHEQQKHELTELVDDGEEQPDEVSPTWSIRIEVDNVDTSRRASIEAITEPVTPHVERAEIIPEIWKSGHPYFFERPPPDPIDGDAWEIIRKALEKYDNEMCKAWNGELDTILVFTGLFSAAVTAFCVESFQNLSQNPADTTNAFLLAISLQLANSSSPVADASIVNVFSPAKHDVQINVLYFISLAFALSVSSVCILGKQWIREYEKDVGGTPCDAVRVRQMRYDSLEAWKVPQIIAALPVVLIVALLLFFTGLLVQLWHVSEHTTAIAVTAVVAFTALLVIFTTGAPAYCSTRRNRASFVPFRSPQAWFFFVAARQIQHRLNLTYFWFSGGKFPPILSSWNAFDLHFLKIEKGDWFQHDISSIHRALRWASETLSTSKIVESCVLWCLESPETRPNELAADSHLLASYVLSGEQDTDASHYPDRPWYDFNTRKFGTHTIESPVGRYQVEMLIRACNQAIDRLSSNWGKAVDQINDCCQNLCHSHGVFASTEDAQYLHDIHNQISLMLQRLFVGLENLPSHSQLPSDFNYAIVLLQGASQCSTTRLSLKVAREVVVQGISTMLRKRKSIFLTLALEDAVIGLNWGQFDISERPFVTLDKIMLEIWSEQEVAEGRTEESLLKWQEIRSKVREIYGIDLATLNGHLPTWNASTARKEPSKLGRFLSVLGLDWDLTSNRDRNHLSA